MDTSSSFSSSFEPVSEDDNSVLETSTSPYFEDPLAPACRLTVWLAVLSMVHLAVNENMTPSKEVLDGDLSECGLVNRSARGIFTLVGNSVICMWTLLELLEVRIRRLCFPWHPDIWNFTTIAWGVYIEIAMKPDTWLLSLHWEGCVEHFGNAVMGRFAIASYAVVFTPAVMVLRRIVRDFEAGKSQEVIKRYGPAVLFPLIPIAIQYAFRERSSIWR
eukprot:TRINITY_DN21084_c0_g3_i1.p1 TRINITY_DN21084_c0_g3~~TRINITY_DN21084_c0_g3_i1.p1  ORF type:complete len:242 (+),score=14.00 TRINITY_DN21084_c0_g3_i1:75-728(+)